MRSQVPSGQEVANNDDDDDYWPSVSLVQSGIDGSSAAVPEPEDSEAETQLDLRNYLRSGFHASDLSESNSFMIEETGVEFEWHQPEPESVIQSKFNKITAPSYITKQFEREKPTSFNDGEKTRESEGKINVKSKQDLIKMPAASAHLNAECDHRSLKIDIRILYIAWATIQGKGVRNGASEAVFKAIGLSKS